MASVRSRLMNSLTRVLMALLCRRYRDPLAFRQLMQAFDRRTKVVLPTGLTTEEQSGAVPGRWLHNAKASEGKTLLYFHGGAFSMRMPEGHTAMLAEICQRSGASAFMPWYRLAPEHRWPAAPEDCLAAYRDLLTRVAAENIVVMGDSAGGNLCLVLMHLIKRHGLPMPGRGVMLSPVLDMAQLSASWRLNSKRDPMYRVQAVVNPVAHYLPVGADLLEPTISPCYGDFSGFPPLLTVVGDIECLLDDSIAVVKKAVEAGVSAQAHIWRGMPHVFVLRAEMPETRLALDRLAQWLREPASQSTPYRGAVRFLNRRAIWGGLSETDNQAYHSHAK